MFIVLVSLVIGGSGLIYYVNAISPPQVHTNVVATATALPRAQATATVRAQATATTFVIDSNPNPYTPGNGMLVLYDPLNNSAMPYKWDSVRNSSGTCRFTGQAYDVGTPQKNFFFFCTAEATDFSNFAFEVHMQILKGDCGGLIFRADTNSGKLYRFDVCQDGTYGLYLYENFSGSIATLVSGSNPAINPGLDKTNVIAVVAKGNSFKLYVNRQPIDSITNSTYSHGQIALFAHASPDPTEVAFKNARVWAL